MPGQKPSIAADLRARESVAPLTECPRGGRYVWAMHAKYYTRFILKAGEPGYADEYTGVVELNQPANSVLDDVAWRGHGFPRADHYSVPLARMVREWDGS